MLLPETEKAKIEQAARVYFLIHNMGLKVADACKQIDISRDQYYKWVRKASGVIDTLRTITRELYIEEHVRILEARGTILGKVIENGESDMTDPLTRLAILQHLEQRGDTLQERLTPMDSEGLSDVLGMPALKKGTSRIVGGVQLDIAELEGGGVNITAHPPVIIDS